MFLAMGCKLAEKWRLRTEEGQTASKIRPHMHRLTHSPKLHFILMQEIIHDRNVWGSSTSTMVQQICCVITWSEMCFQTFFLFQLIKCCHFPSCRWCVMLRRHEESKTGWFSSPKDPIFSPCLGSVYLHFAISVGTQHLWRGPTGSALSDAGKDCLHLRPPPRLLSAISRKKIRSARSEVLKWLKGNSKEVTE